MFFRRGTSANSPDKGSLAELQAEKYLQARGLISVARNYRCAAGEIDLIMREGDTLVFIEVRLRSNQRFAHAAESVNYRKQRKVIKAAQHYLLVKQLTDKLPCRFDVVAIDSIAATHIDWIPDAFNVA